MKRTCAYRLYFGQLLLAELLYFAFFHLLTLLTPNMLLLTALLAVLVFLTAALQKYLLIKTSGHDLYGLWQKPRWPKLSRPWLFWFSSAIFLLLFLSQQSKNSFPWLPVAVHADNLALNAVFFLLLALREEMLLRGLYFQLFRRCIFCSGIIFVQAFVFTALHAGPAPGLVAAVNFFLLGIFLALLAREYFFLAVLFHFFWNFIQAVVFGLGSPRFQGQETRPLFIGNGGLWLDFAGTGLLLLVLVLTSYILFLRKEQRNQKQTLKKWRP